MSISPENQYIIKKFETLKANKHKYTREEYRYKLKQLKQELRNMVKEDNQIKVAQNRMLGSIFNSLKLKKGDI